MIVLHSLLFSLAFAAFPPFLHWCLGSPSITSNIYKAEYKEGRIFSAYGRWLKQFYERAMAPLESVNNAKIQTLYAEKVSSKNFKDLDAHSQAIEAGNYMSKLNAETVGAITYPFFSVRGISKPLGLCYICFSTWLCMAASAFSVVIVAYYIPEYIAGYRALLIPFAFINSFSLTVYASLAVRANYPK